MGKSIFQQRREEEFRKKVESGQEVTIKKPAKMNERNAREWEKTAGDVGHKSGGQVATRSQRSAIQSSRKWYKGSQPTETEMLAKILDLNKQSGSYGRKLYGLYEQAKKDGHWYEAYEKANSPYLKMIDVDPAEITDEFFAANSHLFQAGSHTQSGALSSAKKNGPEAMLAYYLSGLYDDYQTTKALKAEQDEIRREAKYWMDKGLTDDEIKAKLNIGGEGTKYKGIKNAMDKAAGGEFVPTTDQIWAATSWGVDGMLWSLRNPNEKGSNHFIDAIKRDMGQGKPYTSSQADIDRRTMGSDTWSPYTNGTTMDDAAITLGVNGKEGFSPDYWEKNRNRILTTGTDAEKKAFKESWEAEEFTRKAEEQAAKFKAAFDNALDMGMSPDELFGDNTWEEYPQLKELYDGWFSGSPKKITRSVDFDIASYMQGAQDAYNKKMGIYTTDEYEQQISEATGSTYQPNESKTKVEEHKDFGTNVLLPKYSEEATKSERQTFRLMASAGGSDVTGKTMTSVQNGTGGKAQSHEAQLKSSIGYANDHYYKAMDAVNGVGTVYSEMNDATLNKIKQFFPEKYEKGELPTREDVDAILASMPDVNPVQMQADFQNVASEFAYGDVKMEDAMPGAQKFVEKYMPGWDGEYLPTLDDVQEAMVNAGQEKAAVQSMWEEIAGDVDQANVRYAERQQAAEEGQKELEEIYGLFEDLYGKDTEQYNAAVATYQINYSYSRGVPKVWQAYDYYQMATMQEGGLQGSPEDYLSYQRGKNARDILYLTDAIANAKLTKADDKIIANMEQHLADLKTQNELLNAHRLQSNEDYEEKVAEFDAAYTAGENAVLDTSSPAGMINSIIANPGVGSAYYNSQVGQQGSQANFDFLTEYEENAAVMTDEERNNYKYIAATDGIEAAAQYFLNLQENLSVRAYQEYEESVHAFASENAGNAAIATVGSVLLSPVEALEGIDTAIGAMLGEEVNPYEHRAGVTKSASRQGTKDLVAEAAGDNEAVKKVFNTVYDALTSGADSALMGHLGGANIGALAMGFSGFENATNDARMRGASSEQAVAFGLASALIEGGTEKLSIDRMFAAFDAGAEGTKGLVKTLLEGFGSEGLEEAISSVLTNKADDLIMQALSNRDLAIQRYMEAGLTEDEAKAQAGRDIMTEVLYSGLVGGLSGTFTSGAEYGAGKLMGTQNAPSEAEQTPSVAEPGTPTDRAVGAIATANQSGVGDGQKAATFSGVFQSFGVIAEEASATAKKVVENGWGMLLQRMTAQYPETEKLMHAVSMAANAASSRCAQIFNDPNTTLTEKMEQLFPAYEADTQDANVAAEFDASVTESMEADLVAKKLSEAPQPDTTEVDNAREKVAEGQRSVEEARAELDRARETMEASRIRFQQNLSDQGAFQKYKSGLQKMKQAQEKVRNQGYALAAARTILGKAKNKLKAASKELLNTIREEARIEVENRKAEIAQQKEEAAVQAQEQQKAEQVAAPPPVQTQNAETPPPVQSQNAEETLPPVQTQNAETPPPVQSQNAEPKANDGVSQLRVDPQTVRTNSATPSASNRPSATKLVNPVESVRKLAASIGVGENVGTRKMNGYPKTVSGYFRHFAEYFTARPEQASNISVVFHEAGHALAKRLGLTGTDAMVSQLNPDFADAYGKAELPDEAFSEFVWRYMVDDKQAESFAGTAFINQFERALRDSGLADAVHAARDEMHAYVNATVLDRISAMVKDRSYRPRSSIREHITKFFAGMVDATAPLEQINQLVRNRKGSELDAGENIRSSALMRNTSSHRAWNMLTGSRTDAQWNPVGESLSAVIEQTGMNGKDFDLLSSYSLALHSLDRDAQGLPVFDASITGSQRQRMINDIRQNHPEVARAAEAIHNWWHDFMQTMMVDTGYLTQEALDTFERLYPHYVPTNRVKKQGVRRGTEGGNTYTVRRATGSTEEIYNPIDSIVQNVNSIVAMISQNNTGLVFDRLFNQYEGMGIFGRDVTQDMTRDHVDVTDIHDKIEEILNRANTDPDVMDEVLELIGTEQERWHGTGDVNLPNVLTVQRPDGSRAFYQIEDNEMFKSLMNMKDQGNSVLDFVGRLTRGMAALTTGANPLFSIRNFMRDFQKSVNYGSWASNYGTGLAKWLRSAYEVWRESGEYEQYKALGGGGWTRVDANTKRGATEYRSALFKGYNTSNVGRTAKWAGKKLWNTLTLSRLNEIVEQASRYAEYRFGQHDKSTAEGRQEAFLAAQEATVDFTRSGNSAYARSLKQIIPFFNASVQGVYQTGREYLSESERGRLPARFAKTVTNTALASALASALLLKYTDDEEKEEFFWLSDDLKAEHFYLPNIAPEILGDAPLIRVPIAQDPLTRAVHAFVTNAMWSGTGDEPVIELAAIAENIASGFNPISGTIFDAWNSMTTNTNWYGSKIVPTRMESWAPSTQYSDETPDLFIRAGRMLNVSPMKLQYLAEQYTGFLGQIVIPAISKDPNTGEALGIAATIDAARKKLTSDPLVSNGITSEFYDAAEILEQVKHAAKNNRPADMLRRGLTPEEAIAAADEAKAMTSSKGIVGMTKTMISDSFARIEEIEADTTLTDKEKYQLTSEIRREMIEKVLDANEAIGAYKAKYVNGENILNRFFEGADIRTSTAYENLPQTFRDEYDSGEEYMARAKAVWEATGNDSALPKVNLTFSSDKIEYTVEPEYVDRFTMEYQFWYRTSVDSIENWDSLTEEQKVNELKKAHEKARDKSKAWYLKKVR